MSWLEKVVSISRIKGLLFGTYPTANSGEIWDRGFHCNVQRCQNMVSHRDGGGTSIYDLEKVRNNSHRES